MAIMGESNITSNVIWGPRRCRVFLAWDEPEPMLIGEDFGRYEIVYDFLKRKTEGMDRESFWRLDLDITHRLIGYEMISLGTPYCTYAIPKDVYLGAVLAKASSIIVAHTHPMGDSRPSEMDLELTENLIRAGEIVGIEVFDHVIIGADDGCSMKAGGYRPFEDYVRRRISGVVTE